MGTVTLHGAAREHPTGTPGVRFGVLGSSDFALRRMLPAVRRAGPSRVAAIASRSRERADAAARRLGATGVGGYEALLDRDDVDAVYIPLPPSLHAEWIERALLAGKHVLAEKPLTTAAADTERLFGLADRLGLVLRENVAFCHHPRHDRLHRMFRTASVGRRRSFSATFTVPRRPPGDIRHRPELGGGALLDLACYPLRAALMLFDDDLAVRGATLRPGPTGTDLGGGALLAAPDGSAVTVRFGLDDGYRSAYRLTGSTGELATSHAFTPPADHVPVVRRTTADGTERIELAAFDQYLAAVLAFAAAVRGDPGPPGWSPHVSIRQARLVDAIRTCAQA